MAEVLRSDPAKADLLQIWHFIAHENPLAADRQLDRINDACNMLAENPEGGPRREDLAPGLRFFPVGNYLIFYVPAQTGITVLRVLHGSRDYREEFL